jgi:ribosomal protein S14
MSIIEDLEAIIEEAEHGFFSIDDLRGIIKRAKRQPADGLPALWKMFVQEATSEINKNENPVVKFNMCRNCGALDNEGDPHIPEEFTHRVCYNSCERCGHSHGHED